MTLYQTHIPDSTIKIIVWWRTGSFLIYPQGQVETFSKGAASAMAKIAWFHHQVAPPCPCGAHLTIYQKTLHRRPTLKPISQIPTKSSSSSPSWGPFTNI